jgi:hypothetical protein
VLPNTGNYKPFHNDSIHGKRCQRKLGPQRSAWGVGIAEWFDYTTTFQKDIIPPQAGISYTLHSKFSLLQDLNVETLLEARTFSKAHKPRLIVLDFDAAGGNARMMLEDNTQSAMSSAPQTLIWPYHRNFYHNKGVLKCKQAQSGGVAEGRFGFQSKSLPTQPRRDGCTTL